MKILRKFGSTSNVFRTKIRSSTTGNGLTGLTFSSTGGIISTICDNESTATGYTVAGSTIETITTLGTFAAPTATKCRFKEVDATKHPGLYEIQIADARFSVASSKSMSISITGFSGMIDVEITIQLTSTDVDDAVRGGQTALPNTACTGNASLITSGTGTDQLQVATGIASADAKKINGVLTTAVTTINAVFGQAFTIVTDSTGRVNAFLIGILTSTFTETSLGLIAACFKQFFNIASPTSTANLITGTTNAPTAGDFTATMKTSLGTAVGTAQTGDSYAIVNSGTFGNSAIKSALGTAQTGDSFAIVNSGTFGNSAIKSALGMAQTGDSYAIVSSGTNGNAAIKTAVSTITAKLPTNNIADETIITSQLTTVNANVLAIPTTAAPTAVQNRQEMDSNSTKLATLTTGVNATQFYGVSTQGVLSAPGVGSTGFLASAPGGSGGGSGAIAVTITVNDGSGNLLQNAKVTLSINSSVYFALTNSVGVVVLTPNEGNGTYGVAIQCGGFTFTPIPISSGLVVSGATSHTYSMTSTSPPAPTNGTSSAYAYTYDATGTTIVTGVAFSYQMLEFPIGVTGVIPSSAPLMATSDSNGRLLLTGLLPSTGFVLTNTSTGASLPFTTGAANSTTAINGGIL